MHNKVTASKHLLADLSVAPSLGCVACQLQLGPQLRGFLWRAGLAARLPIYRHHSSIHVSATVRVLLAGGSGAPARPKLVRQLDRDRLTGAEGLHTGAGRESSSSLHCASPKSMAFQHTVTSFAHSLWQLLLLWGIFLYTVYGGMLTAFWVSVLFLYLLDFLHAVHRLWMSASTHFAGTWS